MVCMMARSFIHDDFLLGSPMAKRLYHEVAVNQPIIDYHCHLPPKDLANNRRFADLFEIWLEGDHYKWRAMRANGVDERFCTGDATPYEKFRAWAATVPMTLRNPLYHWSHLELARYFGIHDLVNPQSADAIWQAANERLAEPDFNVAGILRDMKVELLCTTDDPVDDLSHHLQLGRDPLPAQVLPTFRPDKAMLLGDLAAWNAWCDALAGVSGISTNDFEGLVSALRQRHDFFHETGCRMSDHGLNSCPAKFASDEQASEIFRRARNGETVTSEEEEILASWLLREVGRWNHERGWVMQLHLGAQRNNNSRKLAALGRDTGFDSIGDLPQAAKLAAFLDSLDHSSQLPKVILYNLNPADNYVFATMIGNFNDGTAAGKIQFGAGWWFLDQLEAMTWQMNALSNLGLLSRFVGMLTDSRSFLSYPRHEYFRRLLCDLLGREVEAGLIPPDFDLLTEYVRRISYGNAREYFPFWPDSTR